MKKLFEIEWMKLIKQRKTKVLLFIGWLGALVLALGNLFISSRTGFSVIEGDQLPLTAISLLGGLVLPLIAYIVSSDFTSGEFTTGTVKYSLMAPVESWKIYFAKFGALTAYNGILLAGVMMITSVVNILQMNNNIPLNIITYLAAYLITLIPMSLVSLWGIFFGSRFSAGLSIALGIMGVAALNIGGLFFPVLASVSPMSYMNLYSMILYGNASMAALVSVLLYLAAYYIMLIAINLRSLQRAEV